MFVCIEVAVLVPSVEHGGDTVKWLRENTTKLLVHSLKDFCKLTQRSVSAISLSRRFNTMTEGITSAADAVELISRVSCSNGARSVHVSQFQTCS
jgi:hypothetical protein